MFLIGSRALQIYGLLNRQPIDWDILADSPKISTHIDKAFVEISSANDEINKTNSEIFFHCKNEAMEDIETPIGRALIAPLNILKVLKISSLPLNKNKHIEDLKMMEHIILPGYLVDLAVRRYQEVEARVQNQKKKFFNKYKVKRLFEHDDLHLYIANPPAYQKVLKNDHAVEVDERKFKALSLPEQKEIFWEEAFVLTLERSIIPRILANPTKAKQIVNMFLNEDEYRLTWLKRLSIVGKVKDHPDWLAAWGNAHWSLLCEDFSAWWVDKMQVLPKNFWKTILK